jgi:hypothetical protein
MKRTVSGALVATALIAGATLGVRADDKKTTFQLSATLIGYNEVPPIATAGKGRLRATLDTVAQQITFELTYSGLEGGDPPLFAHIHFGQPAVNGGVMVFFCGGGGKPACPASKGAPVTVTGTIAATDVVGPAVQGINPSTPADNEFDDVAAAILSGTSYANIHTTKYPAGEIRGPVKVREGEDR